MKNIITVFTSLLFVMSSYSIAMAADTKNYPSELLKIQKQWAIIHYNMVADKKAEAYEKLLQQVQQLQKTYPNQTRTLVWEAIIKSTYAGVLNGFMDMLHAKALVTEARDLLLAAEKQDPMVLNGSVYTSLGSLYYKVPGWPISFGDKEQAKKYLEKALTINPDGMDPNYFYGEFLFEQGEYDQAITFLNKALHAPARPDRPLADKGRLQEIQQVLEQAKKAKSQQN